MKNAERQTEGTQNPKHFINTGICRSHEASLCVPPGAMRKVRSTPFCSSAYVQEVSAERFAAWLAISCPP